MPRPRPARPSRAKPARYWFDETAAKDVCDFFEKALTHSIGEWAGKPFLLAPWQRNILREAFGWKRLDGTRRYRVIYIRIPRKNGKSTFSAGIALYLAMIDREPGADVYGVANSEAQAGVIFREAKRMTKASPELREMCQVFKKSIVDPLTLSSYSVLASNADTTDGLNPHGIVADEVHELKDRPFWDKLTTAGGARRQPMTVITTTAGVGKHTIEYDLHEHAKKVLSGKVRDDEFLPVLFEAGPEDDWRDPAVWKKCNPNWGVSVKPDYIKAQFRRAQLMPGYEASFKRYHLNIDVEAEKTWMRMDAWDACTVGPPFAAAAGRPAWIGMDLSARTDITAVVAVAPEGDGFVSYCRFFVPEEGVEDRARRDGVPFADWIRDGWVNPTPGNVIDYSFIRQAVLEMGRHFDVREVAYDPWGATQLAVQLQNEDGVECVEFRQGFKTMNEPTKKLEELVLARRLFHGANPVLRWMMSNASIQEDAAGNIKLRKRKSTGRIDGAVALVMALGRATLRAPEKPSVYEKRGVVTL